MPNNRITRLDPAVASQLRSNVAIYNQGQAIEELVLNSVDAGSTTVDVLVDAPNFSFEVRDNGSGMGPDDLKMVGEQNATSKLTSFGDEVITNGFRGEALSSIATISCMEVVTKTSASHTIYSKMIQGGTILSFGPATSGTPMTRPHGTTIYVRDLFFKWPVRKKILMASNEMEDIKQRMEAIALAHPNLAFSLYDRAKGVKLMQSKKEQSLLGCFAHLFGVQRVENLCEIRGNTLSPAKLKLSGFASSPFSAGHHSKALQFMCIQTSSKFKFTIYN